MKTKLLAGTVLTAATLLGAAAIAQTPAAQAPAAAPSTAIHEPGYTQPKTSWGVPDLQGYWNNTSITSLQRSPDAKALVGDQKEANRLVNRNVLIVLSKQDQA